MAEVSAGHHEAFTVDARTQAEIDVLKESQLEKDRVSIFPFNPNYISDYRGYVLGMTSAEIDRLLQFRGRNRFVYSGKEFQAVTLISDSLLARISPYFKFPEWTRRADASGDLSRMLKNDKNNSAEMIDLNRATAAELSSIRGIGEVLSARIIRFRDALGGFLVSDQLYDVYGLDSVVAQRALKKFGVVQKPEVEKIDLNTASREELARLIYLSYNVAAAIVAYREDVGQIDSLNELKQIENFPENKIDRIALYLRL
ncbi:MAG TPA: helix-hairpin-helix domain-containing protein [Eudoraea sp.]|nr:helix-hairpin-helix domain-containing protein [Eudoraea sp.]